MAITPLPTPPSRQRPTEFSNEADAFLGALPTFGTEANALQADVNSKQITATNAANTATTQANNASSSATTSSNWAVKTNGYVSGTDNSSKAWAVGGTGTGQPSAGDSKSWASKTGTTVDGADYSSKEYATGNTVPAGSAKEWAISATSPDGSALQSAKTYATQAATSASNAAVSETNAENSAVQASKLNLGPKATAPTADNQGQPLLQGATYYDTALNKWRVWNGTNWVEGISAVAGVSSVNGLTGDVTGVVTETGTQTLTNKTLTNPLLTLGGSNGTVGQVPVSQGTGLPPIWGPGSEIIRVQRTSNTVISAANKGNLIDITNGTFTQTFAAAATLGNGWFCYLMNSGTGDITLDPNASETIDGLTSYIMYPGEVRLVQCDGTELRSVVLNAFFKTFTASGTFTKPPGYRAVGGLIWAGGGSGGKSGTGGTASGGGGGACVPFFIQSVAISASVSVTIGAGGVGPSTVSSGTAGGTSLFGTLVTAHGGGSGFFTTQQSDFPGGGGGGAFSAGANAALTSFAIGGAPSNTSPSAAVVANQGFGGGTGLNTTATTGSSIYGGGAGGAGLSTINGGPGGASLYGGGGGGGIGSTNIASRGYSTYGGSGGDSSITESGWDGTAPGGGGGATRTGVKAGDGARGELRIWGLI